MDRDSKALRKAENDMDLLYEEAQKLPMAADDDRGWAEGHEPQRNPDWEAVLANIDLLERRLAEKELNCPGEDKNCHAGRIA